MAKKNNKQTQSRKIAKGEDKVADLLERVGVGLLYAGTELGQNNIAKIMGMADGRVNEILKGIKKPNKFK
ncbi:MAG: hypothetical protein WC643_01645 [Parcubacteria group bacterium]|jgi:hypothetical protein